MNHHFARFGSGLPATFWWLWAGALVNALASFVFPFLALFLTARGFEVQQAGFIVALFGAGSIVSGPVAGFLADHFGRRPTMLLSLCATAAITALLAALASPFAIACAVLALGIVASAFRPALHATVADVVPASERPRAFGLIYWAVNLGMALSLVAGGALAVYGYGKLFLADAATTLAFAALVWRRVPETHPAATSGERRPGDSGDGGGYAAVLADRALLAFLALNFFFILVFFQFQVAAPVDMARHGLSPAAFGRVLAVNGILIATLQPLSAKLIRRFDSGHVLAVASVLVGAGYGGYALCTGAAQYAAATAIWSLGEILFMPVSMAVVADLSPVELRGRYQGAGSLSFGIGMFASPALGAAFMQRFGAQALWIACLGLGVAVAAGHLAIAGPRRRQLAARAAGGAGDEAESRIEAASPE